MFSPGYATLIIVSHNKRPTLEVRTTSWSRRICNTVVRADPRHLLADDVLCLYFGRTDRDITLALSVQDQEAVHKLTKRADTNEWTDEYGTLSFEDLAEALAVCCSFRLAHGGDL